MACGWKCVLRMRARNILHVYLEPHAHVLQVKKCQQVRNTTTADKTEKCACGEVFCVHSPSRTRESRFSVSENLKTKILILTHWSPFMMFPWMIVPSVIFPTSVLPLSVFPTSSATMMTKRTESVLGSTFSNSDSAIPIFVQVLGPMCFFRLVFIVFGISVGSTLLFTNAQQRFCCYSVVLSFPHWSRSKIWIVTFHRDGALVTTPLVIGRVVGDVDRRELVQVPGSRFLSTQSPTEKFCTARRSGTCSRSRDDCCVSVLLSWRPLLPHGLVQCALHNRLICWAQWLLPQSSSESLLSREHRATVSATQPLGQRGSGKAMVSGIPAKANFSPKVESKCVSPQFSNIPEGPAAAPFRDDLDTQPNRHSSHQESVPTHVREEALEDSLVVSEGGAAPSESPWNLSPNPLLPNPDEMLTFRSHLLACASASSLCELSKLPHHTWLTT